MQIASLNFVLRLLPRLIQTPTGKVNMFTKSNSFPVLGATALLAVQLFASVQAQPPGAQDQLRSPTPRLPDGTVDLGGDGFWNQEWVTDFAARMPNYKEGDLPPMLPWTKAMYEYNQSTLLAYDPQGFCLIPGGPRAMGTPYPSEIIQQRDRIMIVFEGGGHVWREIHMDGRPLPPLEDLNPTFFGYSVGHWDGDTLVVEAHGFNEKTWLDFGGRVHTDQLKVTEYFSRPYKEVLSYRAIIDDPGAYSAPWEGSWDISWAEGQELDEYICQEGNEVIHFLLDDFGNPFFERDR